MHNTKHAILITLNAISVKGKKHYTQPSINTILKLLKRFHKIEIKRCWAFRCMTCLENEGYITRQIRHVFPPGPEIRQIPSLWAFTIKGAEYLVANRVEGAREMLDNMIAWQKQKKGTWPAVKHILPAEPLTSREEAIKNLQGIVSSMVLGMSKKPKYINGVYNESEHKKEIGTSEGTS